MLRRTQRVSAPARLARAALLAVVACSSASAGTTGLVTVAFDGGNVDGDTVYSAVSEDGRFVAFATRATNIVPEDASGSTLDIIVRDLEAGVSYLASKNSEGLQADGDSENPALSADGSRVVFHSKATNLAPVDATPLEPDVFLHDRTTGATVLVSVNSAGEPADGPSYGASISAGGRYVVFVSRATNLDLEFADENGAADAFVHDTETGETRLVSLDALGRQGNKDIISAVISGNGRYVALATAASLIGSGDTNGVEDIYLRDIVLATTMLVSRRFDTGKAAGGACANPALDSTGQIVAFDSAATTLVDLPLPTRRKVYVYDLATDSMIFVSLGIGGDNPDQRAELPSLSPDGRYVCFGSPASNLVDGDTNGVSDAFLHDLVTGRTTRESVASDGTQGDGASAPIFYALSRNASVLAFRSSARTLVPGLPAGTRYRIFFRRPGADGSPPVIHCPEPIAAECQGEGGAAVEFQIAAEDEVDPAPVVVADPPSGSVFPIGTTEVVATATDASGNSAECRFQVRVSDTTPPAIVCPEDIRIETDEEHVPLAVEYAAPPAEDLCDASPSVECDPPSGSLFGPGPTQVTCSARDASGNLATCTFFVNVVVGSSDKTPPEVTCPASFEAECTGDSGAVVEFEVAATDDTDPAPAVRSVPASGSVFPFGTTTVEVTATDASGNSASCTFEVTVKDATAPEIACPDAVEAERSSADGAVVEFEIQASDLCGAVSVEAVPPSGSLFRPGTTTVEATATDASGNSASCTFEVTVKDATAPEIACPDAVEAERSSADGAVVEFEIQASDLCGAVSVEAVPPSGSLFRPGTTTVEATATDEAGNSATCTFEVTVRGVPGVFARGDADADGRLNITDGIYVLDYLFRGGETPRCLDAADCDDDGRVNITDAIFLLRYLFLGGDPVPPPSIEEPGADPTEDDVSCEGSIC